MHVHIYAREMMYAKSFMTCGAVKLRLKVLRCDKKVRHVATTRAAGDVIFFFFRQAVRSRDLGRKLSDWIADLPKNRKWVSKYIVEFLSISFYLRIVTFVSICIITFISLSCISQKDIRETRRCFICYFARKALERKICAQN